MRKVRDLPSESAASTLRDALAASGIEVNVMESQQGDFGVWVIDEQKLKEAQALCERWLDQADANALSDLSQRGRAARELSARIEERKEQKRQLIAERLAQLSHARPVVLTWGLIALCVLVALLTTSDIQMRLADKREMVAPLLIADITRPIAQLKISLLGLHFTLLGLPWDQPWRLLTPMLLHFDVLHIAFNMLWLADLGRTIESRHGARYLALFALVSAPISNIAQYEIAQSPMFGGMSGVVYGLLGLVWARGKFDPNASYGLSRGTTQFMLIWLAIGFIGELASVTGRATGAGMANWCHLFGLLVGVAWGYIASRLAR